MNKADLLVEIGVEELPAQSLLTLANALEKNLLTALHSEKINAGESHVYATPRRLAVLIKSVAETQENQIVERQGPAESSAFDNDGTPTLACIGFAKSCGVTTDQLQIKKTEKGNRVYCRTEKTGEATIGLLPELINQAIDKLPVNKPMRWGRGEVSFVRPVHWLLACLGDRIIPFSRYHQQASNKTVGHRFHNPESIVINDPQQYAQQLLKHHVVANFDERKNRILLQIKELEKKNKFKVAIDQELLNEVTALVEWPVCLIGSYDKDFLKIPEEVLITSLKNHQKCFTVRDQNDKLQPFFLLISNIDSKDPNTVIQGNERVIKARLSDARFFFEKDLSQPLSYFADQLKPIIFQKELGTLAERVSRLETVSAAIAKQLGEDIDDAKQAASLSKFDLASEMVGEFPELQGVMGRYYALAAKQPNSIADSIREHYYPRFSGDRVPHNRLGAVVALADRLDSLCGIFGINKIPSGEKDPYALRRAAQGIVRILIENGLALDLMELLSISVNAYMKKLPNKSVIEQAFQFIMERMRFWYLESGTSAETFSAVDAKNLTSPLDFHQRLTAVQEFQTLAESEALSAANKRVNNLLKKSQGDTKTVNESLFKLDSEKKLAGLINQKKPLINTLYEQKNYSKTLTELASFKDPVDNFFENVMIMVDDQDLRNNRLALLSQLQQLLTQVADISHL